MGQISRAFLFPYVTDQQMLLLLRMPIPIFCRPYRRLVPSLEVKAERSTILDSQMSG
jgi:hypothetical protein